jgi:hypothetical protein
MIPSDLLHDLRRNASSVLAGLTLLERRVQNSDLEAKTILSEMKRQCEETLTLLATKLESKTPVTEGNI